MARRLARGFDGPVGVVSEFDLRTLVREVAAQSVTADPPSIAKQVLARIDPRDFQSALEQALPTIVQHTISRGRSAVGAEPAADQTATGTQVRHVGGGWKRRAIGEWWRRQLDKEFAVGPAKDDWKLLRDCTATDLDYAAGIREAHARSNALAAERMRQLAADLRTSGSETVGDLAARGAAA